MILPAHTARQLRNASLSALYRVAYDHDVDLSDVMASITPSQPIPQAPAAQTDGGAGVLPTPPSVEPIPEAPKPLPDDEKMRRPAEAKTSDQGALSSEPGEVQDRCESTSPTPSKPKRVTQRQRVRECHEAHPDWGAMEIAEETGLSKANVWSIASQIGIKFAGKTNTTTEALRKAVEASPAKPQGAVERAGPPTPRAEPKRLPATKSVDPKRLPIKHQVANLHSLHADWDAARIAQEIGAKLGTVETALYEARAAAGESLSEPIPPATPQTPVAPPPTGEKRTLTERVRSLHQQHPTWTATMIAHELGAKQTSVSTILGQVRGKSAPPPEQPQFSGRRQMVEHYGEIAKRLGKS